MTSEAPPVTKLCTKCKVTKPETVFGKDGSGRRGSICNPCRNERRRARGESSRRCAAETPEERLARKLWEKYKITLEQHAALIAAQGNRCAICQTEPEAGKRLAIDHCHDTGVVRALLCTPCNVAVGFYEKRRHAAEQYLTAYGAGHPLLKQ